MMYKLVVLANIRHDMTRLQAILPIMNAADYVLFCGDGIDDIMRMRNYIRVPLICVRGNNDLTSEFSDMVSLLLGDTRAIVTHGHKQMKQNDNTGLVVSAKIKGCQMVFFGHPHEYFNMMVDDVHMICPGSLYKGSYAVVVGDGITFKCKQQFV